MTPFQENSQTDGRMDGQKDGWKDGLTLFYRTLPSGATDPTSTTAVNWHLKVKDTKYNVGLIISSQSACKKLA